MKMNIMCAVLLSLTLIGQAVAGDTATIVKYAIYEGKISALAPAGSFCTAESEAYGECSDNSKQSTRIKIELSLDDRGNKPAYLKNKDKFLRSKTYERLCSHLKYPNSVDGVIVQDTCSKERLQAVSSGLVKGNPIDPGSYNELVSKNGDMNVMKVQAGNVWIYISSKGDVKAIMKMWLEKVPSTLAGNR